jgi:hypothetical protein
MSAFSLGLIKEVKNPWTFPFFALQIRNVSQGCQMGGAFIRTQLRQHHESLVKNSWPYLSSFSFIKQFPWHERYVEASRKEAILFAL